MTPQAARCPGCGALRHGGKRVWTAVVLILVGVPLFVQQERQPEAMARRQAKAAVAQCWREHARQHDPQAAAWIAQECHRLEAPGQPGASGR